MTGPTLGASTAKWRTKIYEHLVILNTSDDVLDKIVEKVRAHSTHTGSGRGRTLQVKIINSTHFRESVRTVCKPL